MNEWIYIWETPTPFGWVALSGGPRGAISLDYGYDSRRQCVAELPPGIARNLLACSPAKQHEGPHDGPEWLLSACVALTRYFAGEKTVFKIPIDFGSATTFQKSVWRACRRIPYGQTRSYGWVAEKCGSPGAARAVGNALNANPLPVIIPCHRVLRANGDPGGFARGTHEKLRLLHLEANAT